MIDARYFQRGEDPVRSLWVVSLLRGSWGLAFARRILMSILTFFPDVRSSHPSMLLDSRRHERERQRNKHLELHSEPPSHR